MLENSFRTKGASFATEAVALIASNPNKAARHGLTAAALSYGNYDAAGLAIWRAYQEAGCPRAKP